MKQITKKVLIIILFFVIMCLGINNISMAAKYENLVLGRKLTIGILRDVPNQDFSLKAADGSLCIQEMATINSGDTTYVTQKIIIDGNEAKIEKYMGKNKPTQKKTVKTDKNFENIMMSWILMQGDTGSQHWAEKYSEKQKAVYGYIDIWNKALGLGIDTNGSQNSFFGDKPSDFSNVGLIKRAEEIKEKYAGGDAKIENNSGKISLGNMQVNNRTYLTVGPINVKYEGTINSVKAYNQNNKVIQNVKYGKYVGNTFKIYDKVTDAVSSGKNFYIVIEPSDSLSKITKVEATVGRNKEKYYLETYILSTEEKSDVFNGAGILVGKHNRQNLLVIDLRKSKVEKEPTYDTVSIPLDIPLTGKFENRCNY